MDEKATKPPISVGDEQPLRLFVIAVLELARQKLAEQNKRGHRKRQAAQETKQ